MTAAFEWDVVVVGSASTDFLVTCADLPRAGESVRGTAFQIAPGGRGANQAVAAARLGGRVALVARIGADDRGAALLDRLAAERVHAGHVRRDRGAATGVAHIQTTPAGAQQTVTVDGANAQLTRADVEHAASLLLHARVAVMQLDGPLEMVLAAARLAHDAGARVVLDPAPPTPLPAELLAIVDVIKPNAVEATVLTGIHVHDRATAAEAGAYLLARGVGAAAVEGGREGTLLLWPAGEQWLPVIPVERVDATGAGDAFVAAFAVMLAERRSIEEAGLFASAAAALTTTALGAQAAFPRRADVLALLERTGVERAARLYRRRTPR